MKFDVRAPEDISFRNERRIDMGAYRYKDCLKIQSISASVGIFGFFV